MKQFTVPTREEVAPANQAIFDNLQKALGFVPNLYATIGYSENGLARYLAYQNAKSSLSNKEKEAVNLIVSQINGCVYCQSAHTVIGKMNGFTDEQILDLRRGTSADAKLNALANGLSNTSFYAGDVIDICNDEFFAAHGRPDVIITDPPRVGMHEKLVRKLLEIEAPRIVYVSCNPATQARDLQLLNEKYVVEQLQPVDMFPHTHHIENVAALVLRQS